MRDLSRVSTIHGRTEATIDNVQLVDGIRESFAALSCPVTWKRVSVPGLAVAWAGMHVPAVETGGRPWVWEVVTPDQYDSSQKLRDDLLVLPGSQRLAGKPGLTKIATRSTTLTYGPTYGRTYVTAHQVLPRGLATKAYPQRDCDDKRIGLDWDKRCFQAKIGRAHV